MSSDIEQRVAYLSGYIDGMKYLFNELQDGNKRRYRVPTDEEMEKLMKRIKATAEMENE